MSMVAMEVFLTGIFKCKVLAKTSKAYRCFFNRLPTFLPGVKTFYPVEYPVGNGGGLPGETSTCRGFHRVKYRVEISTRFSTGSLPGILPGFPPGKRQRFLQDHGIFIGAKKYYCVRQEILPWSFSGARRKIFLRAAAIARARCRMIIGFPLVL